MNGTATVRCRTGSSENHGDGCYYYSALFAAAQAAQKDFAGPIRALVAFAAAQAAQKLMPTLAQ